MIFTAQHPGSWQDFMRRSENKNLHIQEATRKYRQEMLLFENQYSTFLQQQRLIQQQQSQGGGKRQVTPDQTPEVEMLMEDGSVVVTEDGINLILD